MLDGTSNRPSLDRLPGSAVDAFAACLHRPTPPGPFKPVNPDLGLLAGTCPFLWRLAPKLLTHPAERRCAHTHASLEDR